MTTSSCAFCVSPPKPKSSSSSSSSFCRLTDAAAALAAAPTPPVQMSDTSNSSSSSHDSISLVSNGPNQQQWHYQSTIAKSFYKSLQNLTQIASEYMQVSYGFSEQALSQSRRVPLVLRTKIQTLHCPRRACFLPLPLPLSLGWCFKPQTSFVCRSFRPFSWSRVRLFCSSFATSACRQEDRWQLVLWRGLSLVAAEAKSCPWKVLCLLPSFPCISSPAQSFLSVCLSALAQQHCNYKLNQSYENFSPGALAIISGTRSRYGCCCSTSGHKDGCCSWRSISYGSACDCLHSASGGWSAIL